ncbi:GM14949 [Drosophila sechellia]|uniref:GM14949 n=1 Tax=Drosophila sechellia TaxID=7238 RepID=B4IFQ8_DROSE|nr:GM14949 [Drosophila sechellia]
MQLLWEPRSVQCKIAILIIALVLDVSCIRNGNGEDEQISVKLKNFFPSEEASVGHSFPETSARVTTGGGFRPSQMLDFTPSDVMPQSGYTRYPPSYLEPNYKHELPSSLGQQVALDKQFSFPQESHSVFQSTPLPTTPVVSYLDPYTQQNYRYTPTPPSIIQYQREQPAQDDQAYTVQSSLLVGSHQQNHQQPHPGHVEDVYLKRPGYVFDESPAPSYRRPTRPPPSLPPPPTTAAHKISYDSHDYPPPSYAAEQTSNFVPQQPKQRPLYQRQDIKPNRGGAGGSGGAGGAPPPGSSNYANNFDNYSKRPNPQQTQIQNPNQIQTQFGNYQYNPQNGGAGVPGAGLPQRPRPGHNYYEYQIGEIPPPQSQHFQQPQQQFNYRPATQSPGVGGSGGGVGGGLATLASLYAPQFTNLLLGGGGAPSASTQSSSPLGSLLGAFAGAQGGAGQQSGGLGGSRPPNTQLIRALENIARNDDLQCVPKVLCQMIAGQTLRGQLPGFVTSPAITNFLAGFPVASPALIYGRAALLGLSGGEKSCIQTYVKCPKNDMEIIHYLNNHRGGFFKFFSEPEEKPVASQQAEGDSGSLLSIFSALTGGGGGQSYTTPRPAPRPTKRPSTDITSGIGSFFTQVLSEYLNGVEYQRRRRRRSIDLDEDFHDEEDNLDTQTSQLVKFQDDEEEEAAKAHTELIGVLQFPEDEGEGRVVNFKDIQSEEQVEEGSVRFPDATPADVIREFNRDAAQRN